MAITSTLAFLLSRKAATDLRVDGLVSASGRVESCSSSVPRSTSSWGSLVSVVALRSISTMTWLQAQTEMSTSNREARPLLQRAYRRRHETSNSA